ncbi:MAG: hypothetical protein FWF49_00555 [Oscillospiraceae bacterium]|nr:hypothetical protein [Oscillospiraceae bacterium]
MDGLEAVEVNLSEIDHDNPGFRIDAAFFNKAALSLDTSIRKKPYFLLDINRVVSGPFGSSLKSDAYLEAGEVPFIRVENIRGGFCIDTSNIVYISQHNSHKIKNSELVLDDIILSKVGSIGSFARVDPTLSHCNISENNIGIKLHDYSVEEKHYILTYLNSSPAQLLVQRRISGNVQQKLNVNDVCLIPIPKFSEKFYVEISELILKSETTIKYSLSLYAAAESLLLSALGMDDFTPTNDPVAVKSFSESLGTSGRLDAEYYQEKYEDIENTLNTNDTVNDLCQIYDGFFIPRKGEYQYIELADIGTAGQIIGCTAAPFDELPSRAQRLVKRGQVIVSSIEGSLSSCALITDDFDNAICSTGFYVVDSPVINSETLLVLFKSAPIQALMKKRCSGTILTAISKNALESMPLSKIDDNTQQQIADSVQRSFALRRRSEQLLDAAKHTVEMAIEDGEEAAMAWIAQTLQEQAGNI